VGVRTAESTFEPAVAGVHEHVAVVDVAVTAPQPVMVVPPSVKLTVPGVETVAVMVTAVPMVAVVALADRATLIDEAAEVTRTITSGALESSYELEEGVRLAESTFEPAVDGDHEQVAVVASKTSLHPLMAVPPSVKLTVPGVETVAVMVTSELMVTVALAALAEMASGVRATKIEEGRFLWTVTPLVSPLTVMVSLAAFELA